MARRHSEYYRALQHRSEFGNTVTDVVNIRTQAGDAEQLAAAVLVDPASGLEVMAVPIRRGAIVTSIKIGNNPQPGLIIDIGWQNRDAETQPEYLTGFAADLDLSAASPPGGVELLSMPFAFDNTNPVNTDPVTPMDADGRSDIIVTLKGTLAATPAVNSFYITMTAEYRQ